MGTDGGALVVATLALLAAVYAAGVAHYFSWRENNRRTDEIAAQPAEVQVQLGVVWFGSFMPLKQNYEVFAATPSAAVGSELAVVIRNLGGTVISVEKVDQMTYAEIPGLGRVTGPTGVHESGPALPVVLQPRAGNSVRYSMPMTELVRLEPGRRGPDDRWVRHGFRCLLSNGSEVDSWFMRLDVEDDPDPAPPWE